ncbi:FabG Dehydrogenase [Curvularia clavata]|uniref:FabG Dehydrogenase n=1 Tax=Curvularia clavata TaxID=95742 RepID=A0A9Q8Z7W3_CURCL|nr:FabG Dehydrogenase [Curvularia clavata]
MSSRPSDATLAGNFTKTTHNKPTPALDPKHAAPLTPGLNILIVGASRGIGANTALAYAQAGASSIILAARPSSSDFLLSVAQKCQAANPSASISTEGVDITNAKSVADLAKRVQQHTPRLDIVVLNSGYSGPLVLKMHEGDPQDFSDVMDVNVKGAYLVAHYLVPLLLSAQDGAKTFIAVNSLGSCIVNGPLADTAYSLSKFAQARLVEFLGEQYKSEGLLAVAVHPGGVDTDMANNFAPEFKEHFVDDVTLCGAFCVWLSREKRMWLNGRLVCATWDVDELLEKKDEVEGQDLLKFGFRTGHS